MFEIKTAHCTVHMPSKAASSRTPASLRRSRSVLGWHHCKGNPTLHRHCTLSVHIQEHRTETTPPLHIAMCLIACTFCGTKPTVRASLGISTRRILVFSMMSFINAAADSTVRCALPNVTESPFLAFRCLMTKPMSSCRRVHLSVDGHHLIDFVCALMRNYVLATVRVLRCAGLGT